MSYEAVILSAGGDDSVLVKSFIIATDEAAAQWYSLLSPGVIHGWDDLKQQILSNSISGDSFISEPRRRMSWTPSPLTLQSWV
jgi:hypothetical protein